MAMNILVTGGCGFIGSNLIRHLLTTYQSITITNLDSLTYSGNKANLSDIENDSRYTFVEGSICDPDRVDTLAKDSDMIIHLAAEVSVDRSILDPVPFMQTNVNGTQILLEAARRYKVKRFHYVSTDEVFGTLGDTGEFTEKSPFAPTSPYAVSKACATQLVFSYFYTYGLPVTVSYSCNNIGPSQFPEAVIPRMITDILEGKPLPVHGDGSSVRDWLSVHDHNRAIDLIARKGVPGEGYCVGGVREIATIDLVRSLCTSMGYPTDRIIHVTDRLCQDHRYRSDSRKLMSLGWKPAVSFDEAIKETIAWYTKNREWWQPLKNNLIDNITEKERE